MERRIYKWVGGLLSAAGLAVVLHLVALWDSIPPVLTISADADFTVSRNRYGVMILADALLLPGIFAVSNHAAHLGRKVDFVSWIFVAAFYLGLWFLWSDVTSAALIVNHLQGSSMIDPIIPVVAAAFLGAGFWKWKQDWNVESET